MPAQAGIPAGKLRLILPEIPAFAGMTRQR
jgi:hypothetical protein